MSLHYPNGQSYQVKKQTSKSQTSQKTTVFGKRGMHLEEAINQSNDYYLAKKQAVIYKKPTPIQIVKVDYPNRSQAVIKEAYFRQASTTDYNGIYQGYYLDFEAKETKNKTAFPLRNFHEHQIKHFEACIQQAGICFVIIRFVPLDRIFLLPARHLIDFWYSQDLENGRKSIPLATIIKNSYEIKQGFNPAIAYLKSVDQFIADLKLKE